MTSHGSLKSYNASTTHQDTETADNNGESHEEGGKTPAEPTAAKWVVPSFFFTDDWRLGLFVDNVPLDTLMTMRLLCKDWQRVANNFIDGKVESGVMIVVGENDISWEEAEALEERRSLVTQVAFLLNIMKVGNFACFGAVNLVVVEIPEGITSIGNWSFFDCSSLKYITFPKSLTTIGMRLLQSRRG